MADKKEVKHHEYEKLDHKTLDDVLKHIEQTNFPEIEDAFTDYENFTKDAHLDALKVNILKPSFDEFYKTVDEELGKYFKSGNESIHKKEKEVKISLAKGMMAYLKRARPEIHKALSNNKFVKAMMEKGDNFKEAYELIAHYMDSHVTGYTKRGAGTYANLAKQFTDNEKATVNSLKGGLEDHRGRMHAQTLKYLVGKKAQTSIGKFEPFKIAHYLKEKTIGAENSGYQVKDEHEHEFLMQDLDDLMKVYEGVKTGQWTDDEGRAVKSEAYHVTTLYKEKKKPAKK
jgi:hypothetical protein